MLVFLKYLAPAPSAMLGLLLASFSSSFVSSFCTRLLLLQQSCQSPGLFHFSKGIPNPPPHTHTPKANLSTIVITNKTRLWLLLLKCKIQAEKGGLKALCPSQTCIEWPLQARDGVRVATIRIPAPSQREKQCYLLRADTGDWARA